VTALRRIFQVPTLWLEVAFLHWLLAFSLAWPLKTAISASMAPFSELRQAIVGISEIMLTHSQLLSMAIHTLIGTGIVSFLFWVIAAETIIVRLAHPKPFSFPMRSYFRYLLPIATTSIFALLPRGLLLLCMSTKLAQATPLWFQISIFLSGWMVCTLTLDITRVRIILAGASGFHPKTLYEAFIGLVRQPRQTLYAAIIYLCHICLLLSMVSLASYSLSHSWVIWLIRGLGVVSIGFSFWRIAVAIESCLSQPIPSSKRE